MRGRINFLLPHFGGQPSGGFKIIYTYANYLASRGYKICIIHEYGKSEYDADRSRTVKSGGRSAITGSNTIDGGIITIGGMLRQINPEEVPEHIMAYIQYLSDRLTVSLKPQTWFRLDKRIKCLYPYYLSNTSVPDADFTVATAWQTAEKLMHLDPSKGQKLYLIQHYEIWNGKKEDVDRTWRYPMKKFVISHWLERIGKGLGVSDMIYLPNSISFSKYRLINDMEKRSPCVAFLYSDSSWKGSRDAIAALKLVREQFPHLRCLAFGKAKRAGLPGWVKYYENAPQRVIVEEIYNQASIFLCSSWYEGWGLPAMEAMACGCAVVSTKNGGVEDFAIPEETALLCDVRNVEQMAQAILRLLSDNALRVQTARAGWRHVHSFRWKDSFRTFDTFLQENRMEQ